jgi:hypothetical protein
MSAVDVQSIRIDGGTQPRAAIDTQLVEQYAGDMVDGAVFPPLVVYFDGVSHWLADGFHRYFAAKGCGLAEVECDVREGTVRDAILYSVSANAAHGLRRTNEDKRRAVLTLLNDPTWVQWSDREIARQCAVSHEFVRRVRPAPVVTVNVDSERTYTTRHGTTATMQTANIGRRPDADRPVFDTTDAGRDMTPDNAPTPAQVQSIRDDMARGGPTYDTLTDFAQRMARLPSPSDAARTFPRLLRHAWSARQSLEIADWFTAFAAAWETENGKELVYVAAE